MDAVIEMREVDHFYGTGQLRKQVLNGVSCSIQPGEIVIVTGPSGSGKTTMLTLVGALRSVERGSVRVLGQELNGAAPQTRVKIRENIGFIFQAHNLLGALTARQNVQMSLGLDPSVPPEEARKKATYMLHAVGLGERLDHLPDELSGGQRQRVAIARALVRRPKIILADEPTASLDKASGREVVDLLHQLAKMQGCAILLVTHDHRILDVADRILVLEDGYLTDFDPSLAGKRSLITSFSENPYEVLQHLATLSWPKFVDLLDQVTAEFRHFRGVATLVGGHPIEDLCDLFLRAITFRVLELLGGERITIFVVDREAGILRSRLAMGAGHPVEIEFPITSGIAGRAALNNQCINVADAYSHSDFDPSVDQKTGYKTRNVLCIPIHDSQRSVFAVAQLLNKQNGSYFTEQDEQRFRAVDDPLGAILETSLRLEEKRKPSIN